MSRTSRYAFLSSFDPLELFGFRSHMLSRLPASAGASIFFY
jgi:hypothetical protein